MKEEEGRKPEVADNNCRQHQQRQINLLDHIDAVQDEVSHRMDFIERELDGKRSRRDECDTFNSVFVYNFSFLLVILSTGELDGLHRGAGASWTPVAPASAQTSHETVVDAAGEGASDLSVQLHMRAPEDNSSSRPHTVFGPSETCWSTTLKVTVRLFSTCWNWCCRSFLKVEFNAAVTHCHMKIWTFMESRLVKSGINIK